MNENRRLWIIVIVVGVLAVLLSTCLGALAGGMVGYWAGRSTSRQAAYEYEPPSPKPQPTVPAIPEPTPLLPSISGALITKVVSDGPADRAGIRTGDLILSVDGIRIQGENTLEKIIRKYQPGDTVEIRLWSRGRERTVNVTLEAHPEQKDVAYLGVYYTLLMRPALPQTD